MAPSTTSTISQISTTSQSIPNISNQLVRNDHNHTKNGKSNWKMKLRSNANVQRLVQSVLLNTLLHAIRTGSVEGVRVAIERNVTMKYIDIRQQNLIMLATKNDTESRLRIVIILADAGCDINHIDMNGWSCLHHACAAGAYDVAMELIRRDCRVEYNPYSYGQEDLVIPKVIRAQSLLQETEQLNHAQSVKRTWQLFQKTIIKQSGYSISCAPECILGKPLKLSFEAPETHSMLDRIRIIDLNSSLDTPIWQQVSKTIRIPPGAFGTITLDSETLDQPSLYRIVYEKYEPTLLTNSPISAPASNLEHRLSSEEDKSLVTRTAKSLVIDDVESTTAGFGNQRISRSLNPIPATTQASSSRRMRRVKTTGSKQDDGEYDENEEVKESEMGEMEEVENDPDYEEKLEAPSNPLTVVRNKSSQTTRKNVNGVYKIISMVTVNVSIAKTKRASEYEVVISNRGAMGLTLEAFHEKKKHSPTQLIVRRASGQSAMVNVGDALVAIGTTNIEHAGLSHTLWQLNDALRPVTLRFRRGNVKAKKSLFQSIYGASKSRGNATKQCTVFAV